MSYQVVFQKAAAADDDSQQQQQNQQLQHHCMRCHKSFDPFQNTSTACVLLIPHPFMGQHTTNAKEVDYANHFDICDPQKCGRVLHSFTFHLRLIQAERETKELELALQQYEKSQDQLLQDQLEFLQKLKFRLDKKTPEEQAQLNPKRVHAVDEQYQQVVEAMIEREKEKMEDRLDLERWTRDVLDPSYNEKSRQLFLKAPQAEPKAIQQWARIQQLSRPRKNSNATHVKAATTTKSSKKNSEWESVTTVQMTPAEPTVVGGHWDHIQPTAGSKTTEEEKEATRSSATSALQTSHWESVTKLPTIREND